jgi:hypothetical protein
VDVLRIALSGILVFGAIPCTAQLSPDPVTVSADHPRLFLRPGRLRLLKRERERTSGRWRQFEALMAGNAPMTEPGFAKALYYQVSGSTAAGQQAIAWALGRESDLRQQALVFDWCQDLLSDAQRRELAVRIEKGMLALAADFRMESVRSRALAAVALFDHVPRTPQRELENLVRNWWEAKIAAALKSGRSVVAREDAYPLFEMLHALRDSTNLDLRESCPQFFKAFPIEHLISHYPAPYDGPDAEYHIGASVQQGDPDLRAAAFSRAAELAMVAYDTNAPETQVLQGWLMHDRYVLRGPFGTPYEFLWANPYQPGLSYYHVPLVFYNPDFGRLFVRSSWDDSAKWFGHFDGVMQMFEDGRVVTVNPRQTDPIALEEAVVCVAKAARQFRLKLGEEQAVFIVGLEPKRAYLVEIDDQEMYEATADVGGVLEVDMPRGRELGVRLQPWQGSQ